MSAYLALARKYRPQVFEDIVGQEHVTKTLQRAIEGGRIHHAYLFTGIRGIGKTTCARVLAKALNCKKEAFPASNPCNECVSCTEITAGRSMDVLEIDAASNRGIDDIRELREGVRYTTARDRYKIIIIDEVHMLTEQAFNALLKTLEEPPAHVRFILATTDPQKMPATILSRCQRFDFRRVTMSALVAHLQSICSKEGVETEEEAVAVIARQTQGSVRDSLSLLDQLIAASEGKVTAKFAKEVLGVADRQWIMDATAAVVSGDPRKALTVLSEVFMSGYDVNLFVGEVLQMLRNAMVLLVAGKNRELIDLSESELSRLAEIVKGRNPYDLQYCLQTMLQSAEQIRRSEFPLFAAEEALVRVAGAGQTVQIPQLIRRLVELEQRLAKLSNEPTLFKAPPSGSTPKSVPSSTPEQTESPPKKSGPSDTAAAPVLPPPELLEPETKEIPESSVGNPPEAPVSEQVGNRKSGDQIENRPLDTDPRGPARDRKSKIEDAPSPPWPDNDPPDFLDDEEVGGLGLEDERGPVPPSAPAKPVPGGSPTEIWGGFLKWLGEKGSSGVEIRLLEKCVLDSISGPQARVRMPSGIWALLRMHDLAGLLTEYIGRQVRVEYLQSDLDELPESRSVERKKARSERDRNAVEQLKKHPFVKRGLELFEGELASVEIEEHDDDA